jgi:dTDP-4-dehydrorhamnose reductase
MKILITGAGGMLGTDLVHALKGPFAIIGIGRSPAPHLETGYRQCDLSLPGNALQVFKEEKPQIVFHSAAMTNVDGCELDPTQAILLNEQMTQYVVEAANAVDAFVIYFSTDYVFDGKKPSEYLENDPVQPLNVYGKTKLLGENVVKKTAKKFAIFRVSWLYGLRGKSFPRTILEKAKQQDVFEVVNDQMGRPTFTQDLAGAFRDLFTRDPEALEKMNGQIFNLGNGGFCSWAQFALFVLRQAGYEKAVVKPISSDQLTRPAMRPKNSVLSLEKSMELLGVRLRPWEQAGAEFVKEFTSLSVKG